MGTGSEKGVRARLACVIAAAGVVPSACVPGALEPVADSDASPGIAADAAPDRSADSHFDAADAPHEGAGDAADAGDSGPASCEAGQALCAGACADLQTDSKNCGTCLHDCQSGSCQAGVCQPVVLASGLAAPWYLAVDATYVYWTNHGDGTVNRVPKAGGSVTVLASGQQQLVDIAIDGASAYFTSDGTGGNTGFVGKVAKGGGSPQTLASGEAGPWSIAVDASNVYWAGGGNVSAVPINGGSIGRLAQNLSVPVGVAVDSGWVYFSEYWPPRVSKVPAQGGGVVALVTSGANFGRLVVDSSGPYFADVQLNPQCSVASYVNAPSWSIGGQAAPWGIAVDSTTVYWTNTDATCPGHGTVRRCAKSGCNGNPKTLAASQASPRGIALDASANPPVVYWANSDASGGQIVKLVQ